MAYDVREELGKAFGKTIERIGGTVGVLRDEMDTIVIKFTDGTYLDLHPMWDVGSAHITVNFRDPKEGNG